MSDEREVLLLRRDVVASMVPSGARIVLQEGSEVTLTQAKGNSYTLEVFGNLVRLDGVDADAIGKTPHNPAEDLPKDATLEEKVWALLQTVFDPEIPVNIVDLGLIYNCEIETNDKNKFFVRITMTLTAPGCGMGPVIAADAEQKVLLLDEVTGVDIDLVFDPPWNQDMMSAAAKLELGMF